MSVDAMTTEAAGERRLLDSEEFRDVMGRFASGVTVITADHEGRRYGTTASAVSSLSLEPAMLLVCLNRSSSTGQVIAAARRFAVNILAEGQADAPAAIAVIHQHIDGSLAFTRRHIEAVGGAVGPAGRSRWA
jgi:flavin reductase (DIM6/NTAB) family NADH-FMN oxidoreductase RutF